ncbi:hypothetical protein MITSMUL_04437 [Mitsuokella multacida DSM 20544]|uniref:Uncharacterized protein n=1 Tax=Mitsuokella multacida DSM 20544 TaxID=500635 RepID=C9KMK1_9FIRM|nr:hypothetical protein MITSMUL_04437 [Mitsuokella multacida DSM 20544]
MSSTDDNLLLRGQDLDRFLPSFFVDRKDLRWESFRLFTGLYLWCGDLFRLEAWSDCPQGCAPTRSGFAGDDGTPRQAAKLH